MVWNVPGHIFTKKDNSLLIIWEAKIRETLLSVSDVGPLSGSNRN